MSLYKNNNYRKEISINAGIAGKKALLIAVPVFVLFCVPYLILWPGKFGQGFADIALDNVFIVLIVIISGIIFHEFIHGLFWSFFIENGLKSIKFGIAKKSLTPYCHSKEPMKLKHYRLGGFMPCVILGIVPATISLISGSVALLLFGILFTLAAGGDLLMIWMLRKEDKNAMVQDHPDKIGCYLLN